MAQPDIEELFDKSQLRYSNMTNGKLCEALIAAMSIEKVSRTSAYNLVVAAKTCGMKKSYTMLTTPLELVDTMLEEDTVKMLTIRNDNNELLLCSVAKICVDHMLTLAKTLPKREVHVGSVESMLNKEKAPAAPSRSTVY